MKVLRFATTAVPESIGILLDDGVLNFTEAFQACQLFDQGVCACPITSPMALMEAGLFTVEVFSRVVEFARKHNLTGKFMVGDHRILAPIKRPSKILALGRNYLAHAKESGYHIPTEPIFFGKVNSAVIGPDEPVVYKKSLTRVDPEIELAVIIGKEGASIPEAEAPSHIAGYTIMNDVTARDMQRVDMEQSSPWTRSKGIDTFCPMGPVIVLPDEIQEPIELDLELKVNGETRQKDNTSSLMFKIPKLIEYISGYHTLFPGDVISTGTPEGMKPVVPGDIMEANVEKIGVLRNPVVAEGVIDQDYLLRLHESLVNIPSVYPQEEEIMLFLENELRDFHPTRLPLDDGRFNLLVRLGSGSPVLCLNAHSDTVQPSGNSVPRATIRDGRMYGLGSVDDKACIAAMLCAFKSIAESKIALNGTLDLLISVDEEGSARGVRTAVRDGYKCDMAITGEATSLEIVSSHCGLVFLDIVTHGKSTHGSIPWEGVSAIDRMCALVEGLKAIVASYSPHPTVGPASLNLGIIRAGDRPNRVPDRCEASIDIRIVPPMTADETLARVDEFFSDWPDAEYAVTKKGEPLDTPQDSPLVRVLSEVSGCSSNPIGWRGWTEAESCQTGLGIDSVVFGPGALVQAHSANEWVDLAEVSRAADIYARTALAILTGADE